MNALVLTLV